MMHVKTSCEKPMERLRVCAADKAEAKKIEQRHMSLERFTLSETTLKVHPR